MERASPFERLHALLSGLAPGDAPIDLSVGSPRHPPPAFVPEVLAREANGFGPYPPFAGTATFQTAVHDWIDRRYRLDGFLRERGGVLPVAGSRDGLFFTAITVRDLLRKERPALLFANPFYQAYPAAAHAAGLEGIPVPCAGPEPLAAVQTLDAATLARAVGFYVGSPANPEGTSLTASEWHRLFDLAEAHDFFVLADECYSEIYREAAGAPTGALTAARERPAALDRLLVFNSLSKRSNLAGLRVGFVAGGREPMAAMHAFRSQAAPQVPVPLQAVAASAYADEAHVVDNRALYDEKFDVAARILTPLFGEIVPPAGFFLWLPVGGDDEEFCRTLWREAGVRAVPGSYLAATTQDGNPGAGHVRLALVGDLGETERALTRVADIASREGCILGQTLTQA